MYLNETKAAVYFLTAVLVSAAAAGEDVVDHVEEIAPVWSGHPVGFALLTQAPYQYVAFYDADRNMTIGMRSLDPENDWSFGVLPERVGWDSHKNITMTLDDDGCLHVAGNMHVVPLVYFRMARPHDVQSLERVEAMIGSEEARATYPRFFRGPANELIFTYRDGSSGSGNQICNAYDHATRTWGRLLDQPLVDGEGERNAYLAGPQKGPDGYFHLCWVWRDHPGCESNHDLSYARSKDLRHWENSSGEALRLPITFATAEVVDPVPPGGGIINGNARMGFDHQNRVVLTYHKHDEAGNTQVYNARREDDGWHLYRSSNFDYRWDFSGGGTIPFEMRVNAIRAERDGTIVQTTSHNKLGTQRWRLDPDTLAPLEQLPLPEPTTPSELYELESSFPGMSVRFAGDMGRCEIPGARYLLRWETLGPHRDRPREKPWPEPTMLRLYRLKCACSARDAAPNG